jgi:hypothetical protein
MEAARPLACRDATRMQGGFDCSGRRAPQERGAAVERTLQNDIACAYRRTPSGAGQCRRELIRSGCHKSALQIVNTVSWLSVPAPDEERLQ